MILMKRSLCHPGNQEGFDEQTPIGDKCVKNDMSTDDFLPPFDPSSPVGETCMSFVSVDTT